MPLLLILVLAVASASPRLTIAQNDLSTPSTLATHPPLPSTQMLTPPQTPPQPSSPIYSGLLVELISAASDGRLSDVERLISEGANVNEKTNMSPLNAAAERGHADIVDVILRAGADVNLQVVVGMTPLCFAASNGHLDIVVMLLDAGADPNLANDSEYTALTYAALRGYPDIARVLLDRGAVNYRQSNGDTPGSVATRFNHPEIAEMIASYFVPPPSSGGMEPPLPLLLLPRQPPPPPPPPHTPPPRPTSLPRLPPLPPSPPSLPSLPPSPPPWPLPALPPSTPQVAGAGFVPINGPGMQIAENVDSAIQVEFRGSFMAGSLINDGNLPGIPAQAFRNKNLLTSDNAAGWIMAACHDGRRIVVALEITLQSGGAYVVATDAGYVNAACALTAYAANNVWRTWDTVDVAACATCSGYGIHSLETYLAPVRPFVPVNEVGILVAENTTSAVEVILSVGSYMAGRSLNNGNFPGVPARPFRSTSAPAPNNTHATWIMACCNGQDIKMVELQIGVRAGSAFVMATGAGYYRTACNLNASIVNSGWLDRTSMDIATCITCMDYGIHSLALFAPGEAQLPAPPLPPWPLPLPPWPRPPPPPPRFAGSGQGGGVPDDALWYGIADAMQSIKAPQAWDIYAGKGGAELTVCILESMDVTHEDLQDNMHPMRSYDPETGSSGTATQGDGENGTHMAGTIAAVGNNRVGVVGVAWGGSVKLLGCQSTPSSTILNRARCLRWCREEGGAQIAVYPWTSSSRSQVLENELVMYQNWGGLLFSVSTDSYPGAYPLQSIVNVGAIDPSNGQPFDADYGANLTHLFAPGGSTLSTVPRNGYGLLNGLRPAVAHAAGAAALLWSYRPALTAQQVKSLLLGSVDKQDNLKGLCQSGGVLNVHSALLAAQQQPREVGAGTREPFRTGREFWKAESCVYTTGLVWELSFSQAASAGSAGTVQPRAMREPDSRSFCAWWFAGRIWYPGTAFVLSFPKDLDLEAGTNDAPRGRTNWLGISSKQEKGFEASRNSILHFWNANACTCGDDREWKLLFRSLLPTGKRGVSEPRYDVESDTLGLCAWWFSTRLCSPGKWYALVLTREDVPRRADRLAGHSSGIRTSS
mmetsp:Transcript_42118/g.126054  ORF Transcript_42118/g.126054 Transcript_42118/m.126054 type:complete len:1103 (-) Transcript_42118:630-3938(-)